MLMANKPRLLRLIQIVGSLRLFELKLRPLESNHSLGGPHVKQ